MGHEHMVVGLYAESATSMDQMVEQSIIFGQRCSRFSCGPSSGGGGALFKRWKHFGAGQMQTSRCKERQKGGRGCDEAVGGHGKQEKKIGEALEHKLSRVSCIILQSTPYYV